MISRSNRTRLGSILRPPERLSISEHAHRYYWLPEEGNAEAGKFRLSRMPHQAAMLDDPIDPGVREIYWMMASQFAGKTLCLSYIICFCIEVLRKSVLLSKDTKDRAVEWMRDKFMPIVRATPRMHGLLREPRKRDSESTVVSRKFPGGVFKVIGAKSVGAFRGTSAGKVFQDEIDSEAYDSAKEGAKCALIDRAALTFQDAWKLKCSTTTLLGFSRVHAGFLKGDQQYYFVPCPICGEFQFLKDEQLKFSFTAEEAERDPLIDPTSLSWAIGKFPVYNTRRALYVCEHCHRGWTDQLRIESYMSGHIDNSPVIVSGREIRSDWRATAPFNGIRSRSLSGMYATIGLEKGFDNYLHMFAEKFLEAKKGGRETLMAWTNMFANKPFEDEAEKVDWKELSERSDDYDSAKEVPPEVCWINWGGDVQDDRVEILWFGWGDKQECWFLEHNVMYGDVDKPEMKQRIKDYLIGKRFKHPVLGEMAAKSGMMDSRRKPAAVYKLFDGSMTLFNFWSVRGFDDVAGVAQFKTERRFGGRVVNLDVSAMKALVYNRLRNREPGPNYIHFPKKFGPSFYAGLCSEKCVLKRMPNGAMKRTWVKLTSSTRNEILDMTDYAFGNYFVCKPDFEIEKSWKQVQAAIPKPSEIIPPRPTPTIIPEKETRLPEAKERPLPMARPGRRRFTFSGSPFNRRPF